jgi:hypothetical protein
MSIRSLIVLSITIAFLVGCEDGVSPSLGIEHPYTLWGIINPQQDTQAVRVFEIQETIQLVRSDPIDVVITSTHLQTGTQLVWKDSVIQLPDGDYRHVYWAPLSANAGDTFLLEARRSDGATSSAQTTVPPPVTLEILEPNPLMARDIKLPIFITGNPPNLPRIDLEYRFLADLEDGTIVWTEPVVISYSGRAEPASGGWSLDVRLSEDLISILRKLRDNEVRYDRVILREMELRVHVGDEKWRSPIGFFDSDFLVEPGTLSNVENGFGFFGSGYMESIQWRPSDIMLARAGFYIASDTTTPTLHGY